MARGLSVAVSGSHASQSGSQSARTVALNAALIPFTFPGNIAIRDPVELLDYEIIPGAGVAYHAVDVALYGLADLGGQVLRE